MFENVISDANKLVNRLLLSVNQKECLTNENRSFDEIMTSEWEELVITFDKQKNDYVFRTACCPGAPAC